MAAARRLVLAALACLALGGCQSTTVDGGGGGDCVSHYDPVAEAATWPDLKTAMLDTTDWGRVASVRTQATGDDIGAGDEDVVRLVDLLDKSGRRLAQADVWRTDSGGWSAGVWSQCID